MTNLEDGLYIYVYTYSIYRIYRVYYIVRLEPYAAATPKHHPNCLDTPDQADPSYSHASSFPQKLRRVSILNPTAPGSILIVVFVVAAAAATVDDDSEFP